MSVESFIVIIIIITTSNYSKSHLVKDGVNTARYSPGTTATVLRARKTLKVRNADTFPNFPVMVAYLQTQSTRV